MVDNPSSCQNEINCPFAEGWKNREGWLYFNDKLVCLDWDDYCTLCRVDDGQDYVFDFSNEKVKEKEKE